MKAVKRKLESRAGASILISLMFFLVVMMVGVVCLVAAYNNSGRATHARDDVQRYNAVESAMNLLIEDMKAEKAKFVLTKSGNYYKIDLPASNPNTATEGQPVPTYGKLVYDMMVRTYTPQDSENILYSPASGIQGTVYKLELNTGDTYKKYLNVNGEIQLGTKECPNEETEYDDLEFDLTVSLWVEDSSGNKYYKTTMLFPAYVRTIDIYNAVNETVTEKLEVSWYEPQITRTEA